mmetsp:Transcript_30494/g.29897  ORF Transcript_30494/g.29897 Transcript_30494/m.29897 type:complete len:156 (+) Transcript_30494:60-527(+)
MGLAKTPKEDMKESFLNELRSHSSTAENSPIEIAKILLKQFVKIWTSYTKGIQKLCDKGILVDSLYFGFYKLEKTSKGEKHYAANEINEKYIFYPDQKFLDNEKYQLKYHDHYNDVYLEMRNVDVRHQHFNLQTINSKCKVGAEIIITFFIQFFN